MDTRRNDPYPDVTAAGGLVSALGKAAKLVMGEIWPVPSPTDDIIGIETARGILSVVLATEERLFRVRVHIPGILWETPGFTWEIGSTDEFGLLVEAVVAWRQGVPFDGLAARFTFLELEGFARALDEGEPTSLQWAGLLSAEFHRKQWNLLRRLRTDEVLRNMFPTITHGAVRLCADPLVRTSRQVMVYEPEEDRYEVIRPGVSGADWVEVPTGDLIAHLRAAMNQE
ncbi:hypothetical protein AB0D74_43320 [Streptomyces sp. NPDC048278]|uniref:hypothetical protein n=1 Tax=Streptomyces sp. NPDC048278 TaxID=3155809 RepID=UPI00343E884D